MVGNIYRRGSKYERELIKILRYHEFLCLRVAKSGNYLVPFDVVAFKRGNILAFEVKAWAKEPKIEKKKEIIINEWEKKTSIKLFIAWRKNNNFLFKKWNTNTWMRLKDIVSIYG